MYISQCVVFASLINVQQKWKKHFNLLTANDKKGLEFQQFFSRF